MEALQGFVNRFIDFEIVEHGENYVIIKEMGEPTTKEFENSLRRIFLLIQNMAEETLKAIQTDDPKSIIHMHDIDVNLDKFRDYCVRILNRVENKDTRETALLSGMLYFLELIGDEFNAISHLIIYDFNTSKHTLKNLAPLAESTKKEIDIFYDLFYRFDKSKIALLSELDQNLYMGAPETYKKISEEAKEIFHHFRIINRYVNALMELRIEIEFNRQGSQESLHNS
jgi:phosphate uptake regulator